MVWNKGDHGNSNGSSAVKRWIRANYKVGLILIGIFLVAFLVRSYFAFSYVYSDTPPKIAGNDPYYHKRAVDHIIQTHHTLVQDPMLNYPVGGGNANPPLFEWGAALFGYLASPFLGSVGEGVDYVYPVYPIIWSALLVFPIYALGRTIFNRKVGLLAAFFIALTPAQIERISLGFADHDSMVLFFITSTFYFFLMALRELKIQNWVRSWGRAEDIVYGMYAWQRDNRVAIGYAVLAGLALAGVGLIWKGLAYVFTIIFLYFMFELLLNKVRNTDSMGVTFIVFITLVVAMLTMLPYYYATNRITYLDAPIVFMTGMVLFAMVFVPTRDRPWITIIPTFFILIGVGIGVLYLAFPDLWYTMSTGMGYFVKSKLVSTIAEAQPGDFSRLSFAFGMLNYFMALVGFAFLVYRFSKDLKTDAVFLLIWSVVMIYMALSTVRFMHDASPIFALLSAYMIYFAVEKLDPKWRFLYLTALALVVVLIAWGYAIGEMEDYDLFLYVLGGGFAAIILGYIGYFLYEMKVLNRKDLKIRHVFGAIFFAFFLMVPNVWFGVDAGIPYEVKKELDPEGKLLGTYGSSFPSDYWVSAYDWLSKQDTGRAFEDRPAFVSWWDYGFWCIYMGQHPTVADNFQWGYQFAGSFIVAQSEEDAVALSIVRVIEVDYAKDDVKKVLIGYVGEENYTKLCDILSVEGAPKSKQDALIKEVSTHPERYGPYHDLKIRNAKYAAARYFFTSRFDLEDLVDIYADVSRTTGHSIRYFAVEYRIFQFSAKNTGIFYAPVKLSDHTVTDYLEYLAYGEINYGTRENPDWQPVGKPLTQAEVEDYARNYSPYFRITGYKLRYKQEFFNTMMYKCYIGYDGGDLGMFDENGYPDQGIPGLSDNDDKTKADSLPPMQGWMMKHYRLVYKTTYWNPHNQSELDRNSKWYKKEYEDDWVAMNYDEAVERKNKEGGVISSGLRAGVCMLKYYHGAILEGKVKTEGGQGVGGARVTVLDEYGIPHDTVITDKDGSYRVILPFGKVTIMVSNGGFETGENANYAKLTQREKNVLNTTTIEVSDDQAMREGPREFWTIDRDLTIKGAKLSGRVFWDFDSNEKFDEGKDEAINGSVIELNGTGSTNVTYKIVADANGTYRFDDIIPGTYTLMTYVKGHRVESTGGVTEIKVGDNLTDSDLPVKPPKAIVHIRGEDGRNLSGVEVALHDVSKNLSQAFTFRNSTDENGTVEFTRFVGGKYVVEIADPRYKHVSYEHDFSEGDVYETNITLVPVCNVGGVVWYDRDHNAHLSATEVLRGARLTFVNTLTNESISTMCGMDGRYDVALEVGNYSQDTFYTYEVYGHWDENGDTRAYLGTISPASIFGINATDYTGAYNATDGFTTIPSSTRSDMDLRFARAFRVNGTVLSDDGVALSNMAVRFIPKKERYSSTLTPVFSVPVNAEGMFLTYLPEGEYFVYVIPTLNTPSNNGTLLATAHVVADTSLSLTVHQRGKLKGHVYWDLDNNGAYTNPHITENVSVREGLEGMTVVLKGEGGEVWVETGKEGYYEIDVPPGTYSVEAYDAVNDYYVPSSVHDFHVHSGLNATFLNISLVPRPVNCTLRVYHDWNANGRYDSGTEIGERGVSVEFHPLDPGRGNVTGIVGEDGSVKVSLIPGRYLCVVDYMPMDKAYHYKGRVNLTVPFTHGEVGFDMLTSVSVPLEVQLESESINLSAYLSNISIVNNGGDGKEGERNNTLTLELHNGDGVLAPKISLSGHVIRTNVTPGEYSLYVKIYAIDVGLAYVYAGGVNLCKRTVVHASLVRAVEVLGSFIYHEGGRELSFYGQGAEVVYYNTEEAWSIHIPFNGSVYKAHVPNGTYMAHFNYTTSNGKYRYMLGENSSEFVVGDDGNWHPTLKLEVTKFVNVTGRVRFKGDDVVNAGVTLTEVDGLKEYELVTNATGVYSAYIPVGTYNVTVHKYGYLPTPEGANVFNLSDPATDFDIELIGGKVTFTLDLKGEGPWVTIPESVKVSLIPYISGDIEYGDKIKFDVNNGHLVTEIEPGKYIYEIRYQVGERWFGAIGSVAVDVAKPTSLFVRVKNASEVMVTLTYRDIDDVLRYNPSGTLRVEENGQKLVEVSYTNGGTSLILPYGEYRFMADYSTTQSGLDLSYSYTGTQTINMSHMGILLELNRNKEYNVELTYDEVPEFFVNPGDVLEFKVRVKNMGNTRDTIEMSFVSPEVIPGYKWDVSFEPESLDLKVFEEGEVNVTVNVPAKVKPEGTLTIKAASKSQGSVYDTIEFDIGAPVFKEFFLNPLDALDKGVMAGESVDYRINLSNQGNDAEDFNITYEGLPEDWNISASIDGSDIDISNHTRQIGPYENITVSVTLHAPNLTVMVHDTATVTIKVTAYGMEKTVKLRARIDTPDLKVLEVTYSNLDLSKGDMVTIAPIIKCDNAGMKDGFFVELYIDNEMKENQTHGPLNESEMATVTFKINATAEGLARDYHSVRILLKVKGPDKYDYNNEITESEYFGPKAPSKAEEFPWGPLALGIILVIVLAGVVYWWKKRELV